MVLKKVLGIIRPPLPIAIGFCLGITISLVLHPQPEQDDCTVPSPEKSQNTNNPRTADPNFIPKSMDETFSFDYGNEDDFKPRRVRSSVNMNPVQQKKILRPRYISTELGIREKLFVGVLTSRDTVDTVASALNKTLAHHVPKLVYFMDNRGPSLPPGMSIVSFSDEKTYFRPFHMLKYVASHYAQNFDYFLFTPDSAYIRGSKVLEMVSGISASRDVYMGRPIQMDDQAPIYCDFRAGIILSQNLLSLIIDNLDWCMKEAVSSDNNENIGKCFFKATGRQCKSQIQDKEFFHYIMPQFEYDSQKSELFDNPLFERALSVFPLSQENDYYQIHRFYSMIDLNSIQQKLKSVQEKIVETAPYNPEGNRSLTWPVGVDPPVKPKTRFDVIRWDYFTEKEIYLQDDFTNVKQLTGIHKLDVDDVIKVSIEKLTEKYSSLVSFIKLRNGYRRFDPTRGMEYVLDLILKDSERSLEFVKRVNLVRPLSHVEIVPMPYVTESTRVNLILPVTTNNKNEVVSFLDSYAHTCLDSGDNTNLFVVFVYETLEHQNNKDDIFSVLKSMISYYESKYMNGARISWMALHTNSPTQMSLMDVVSERYSHESLFLLCTVGMEVSIEFLNRVRMNTITNYQVFFPVGFWQYKPNLVYEEKPWPTTIEINRNVGHFDNNAYDHASFYNSDYIQARRSMTAKGGSNTMDLFELFLGFHDVHVFRAVEPALLLRYRERTCEPTKDEDAYKRCLKTRAEGLASRSQLAMLIFEHQQKMNQEHLYVVQKQHNPNVQQMKPNMM